MQSIIDYQHKILRKYTILGYIQYPDAPFFHDLVDRSDYKMISIFEVFAINRNEDDFLENIALFAEVVQKENDAKRAEEEKANKLEEQKKQEETLVQTDPNYATIVRLRDADLLTQEEADKCKTNLEAKNKKLLTTLKFGAKQNNDKELAHTLKIFCKKC